MKLKLLLGGMALAAALAGPAMADDVKIGFITKFPVPYFATMEDAAKAEADKEAAAKAKAKPAAAAAPAQKVGTCSSFLSVP